MYLLNRKRSKCTAVRNAGNSDYKMPYIDALTHGQFVFS